MPRILNKLTDKQVRSLTKPGRHSDGGGLYLNISKTAAKSWLFMWKAGGKRREMGLGSATGQGSTALVNLATARKKAEAIRQQLAEGKDPLSVKRQGGTKTFGEAADDYVAAMSPGWRNAKHAAQWKMTLTVYAEPIRSKLVSEIDTDDVLTVLKPIWLIKPETASRFRGRIEQVLDWATTKRFRTGENPARWRGHLKNLLPKRQKLTRGHHAAMPYTAAPSFIERLRSEETISARALEFLILTTTRTSEVTGARWNEIDMDTKLWTLPAERMKAGKPHRVPLSERAAAILAELQPVTPDDGFVFPGAKRGKSLSNMAMAARCGEERLKINDSDMKEYIHESSTDDWCNDKHADKDQSAADGPSPITAGVHMALAMKKLFG